MKNNASTYLIGLISILFFTGCSKNIDTNYFEDPETTGIGIFSNSGNNLQSCFIDGKAWRTIDRDGYLFGNPVVYEVNLLKSVSGNPIDTLQITWQGYYSNNKTITGEISLHLAVPSGFTYTDFSAFEGQRVKIDSAVNGYFTTTANPAANSLIKGNGNIYFNRANTDSIPQAVFGKMSGLFDADFNSFKITSGRFDHILTTVQVNF